MTLCLVDALGADNPISDGGVQALALALPENENLKHLYLNGLPEGLGDVPSPHHMRIPIPPPSLSSPRVPCQRSKQERRVWWHWLAHCARTPS